MSSLKLRLLLFGKRLSQRRALLPVLLGLAVVMVMLGAGSASAANPIPTITIVAVEQDTSVTIRTHNFPANRTFTARMGVMGSRGVNGALVGNTNSGAGGSFDVTYPIPDALQGSRQLAIRLEAPGGYFAYSWFYNRTAVTDNGDATPTPAPTGTPAATVPTLQVINVQRDNAVTVRTANFPANQPFTVRMGRMGTRGIDGTVVTTTNSGSGGAFEVTYNIPENLKGLSLIAIRLESPSGHYAYNWFYNSTTR